MSEVIRAAIESTIPNPYIPNKYYRWNKESALYRNTKGFNHFVRIEAQRGNGKVYGYAVEDYLLQGDIAKYKGSIHIANTLDDAIKWMDEQTQ